ncbi:MAG: hypothetical protein A2008_00870 [Candidatus Wallbacteria bacterium GWC2_49_35]|uniref:Uncharacterized protein n=1 Tax=Candidatus Wallbacteria bacterium GWC2_49_35 TaxID=1817813 RepID=A0A1F7WPT0_9BACT|nr:MAG: hypothetical protein A2008_00870 [Candidatus Wallbacteria bacterium GWC2_49_35]HBC75210.1 hypothetical protein [Candidatus Wallbacteria bacterium]
MTRKIKDKNFAADNMSMKLKLNFMGYIIFLMALLAFNAGLNAGCSGSRDSALSLVDEPAAAATGSATKYRFSSSALPTLNIKPLIDDNCVRCHNSEIEPDVPLTSYLEVYTRGVLVKRAVQPGGIMQKYLPFDYDKVMEWYEAGMPE